MSIWVGNGPHRFARRTVQTGMRNDGFVQILDGLSAGEPVVTDGAIFLSNELVIAQ
jgi:cobalt-zinc-cadmium efflux system membrane fusion protein